MYYASTLLHLYLDSIKQRKFFIVLMAVQAISITHKQYRINLFNFFRDNEEILRYKLTQ